MKIDALTLENVQRALPQLERLRDIKGTDERRLRQSLVARVEALADLQREKSILRR